VVELPAAVENHLAVVVQVDYFILQQHLHL
jgi:hypothetical protein